MASAVVRYFCTGFLGPVPLDSIEAFIGRHRESKGVFGHRARTIETLGAAGVQLRFEHIVHESPEGSRSTYLCFDTQEDAALAALYIEDWVPDEANF